MTKTVPTADIELAGSLVRLSHLVQHVFADVSRQHDLTPQQAQLLCVLMNGPLGMSLAPDDTLTQGLRQRAEALALTLGEVRTHLQYGVSFRKHPRCRERLEHRSRHATRSGAELQDLATRDR